MDEEYDNFLEIEVQLDDEENPKKKKKNKNDFIEIDAIERTIEFIEQEKEVEAQTKRRRSTTGRGFTLINNTFDPSKILNLSLWLKADAGVTMGNGTPFISSVVISGAGSTTSNGTYTRTSGEYTTFNKSGGGYLNYGYNSTADGDVWQIFDTTLESISYYTNDQSTFSSWIIDQGSANAPSSTTSNTTPQIVVGWTDQSSATNNFSGSASIIESAQNGKPAIYFNGIDSYLNSPSTLLDNFSQISLFGVWSIPVDQYNKGIFGTNNYSNLEISTNPDVSVRIRNGNYTSTFIQSGFSNVGAWTISYLDAQNQSGVFYKNGQEQILTYVSQIILTGAGTSTSNGTYTRASGSATQFTGPNGNYMYLDGGDWYLVDGTLEYETYTSIGETFTGSWAVIAGSAPAPTQTLSYTTGPIAVSTAVQMPLASGVTYSLGRYAYPSFTANAEMYVSEFIIYNRRLTTPERQQVEQYLNSKYQIY